MRKVLVIGSQGYVGSRLLEYLGNARDAEDNLAFSVVGHAGGGAQNDYRALTSDYLQRFHAVVLMAALSNPARCMGRTWSDVYDQNVARFHELTEKLDKDQKFVYASSSSVYGEFTGPQGATELDALIKPDNHYDASKMLIDIMAQRSGLEYYGLRFGTVSGPARNMREDVIVNAMVESAYCREQIRAVNPSVRRPILCVTDCCRAVEAILKGGNKSGIYNLASFNTTVREIAMIVQDVFRDMQRSVCVVEDVSEVMYDFTIDCTKFRQAYGFRFKGTLRNLVVALISHYTKQGKASLISAQKRA